MTEIEDLRRRLEVAETELKLVLEGSRGQKEVEEPAGGATRQREGRRAPTNGAEAETVQISQHSGRKSRRGEGFVLLMFFFSTKHRGENPVCCL